MYIIGNSKTVIQRYSFDLKENLFFFYFVLLEIVMYDKQEMKS